VRILFVSSLYPGPDDPDYGVFVRGLAEELERQGHELDLVVSTRRTGSLGKQLGLLLRALAAAVRRRPDVVYAHYLVPAGAIAAIAAIVARRPLVVTAYGRDVRNVGTIRGVRALTRFATGRAARVVTLSEYLRRDLVARLPELDGKVDVVSPGVDLERFGPRDAAEARASLDWDGEGPFFVCVGTLDERKNVVRLADAFAHLGRGSLAFVGEGPARGALEGRQGVTLAGRVPHDRVVEWVAACDVLCQPSLVEPFGVALLEAMAGERSVVATNVGGPPEFVAPEAGVLVDPTSVESIERGLRDVLELPSPNPAARAAAAARDVRVEAARAAEILRTSASARS
jgi:glycosyltransferase involved in cell wall biosynthesis